ncbi:MAG: LamG domain-containing protein [Polyangia bacterium]
MASHRTFVLIALALAGCTQGRLDVVVPAPNSLQQDMVAHWPCDEGSGATLGDIPSHSYDGTILGATWLIPGHFGNALHFSSGNSVIVSGSGFPQATPDWSVSLWVRPQPQTWVVGADFGDNSYITLISTEIGLSGGWEMNAQLLAGDTTWKYSFAYPDPGDAGSRAYQSYDCDCLEVGQWTHLVAVVDSSSSVKEILFYKNGVLDGEKPITDTIHSGSNALYLGTWSGGERYFVGDLDDIVIYSRALTADEVALLYKQPAPTVLH